MRIIQFIQKPETVLSLTHSFQALHKSESPAPSQRCSKLTVNTVELNPDVIQAHQLQFASMLQPIQAKRAALLIALITCLKQNCLKLLDAMKVVPLPCIVLESNALPSPQAASCHTKEFASFQLLR